MSIKRPRSPTPVLCLTSPRPKFFESSIHIDIQTSYSHLCKDGKPHLYNEVFPYGLASIKISDDYSPPQPHYVYVIDTSLSMSNGRLDRAVRGLEATCHILDRSVMVSIFSFESKTALVYSGLNPVDQMAEVKAKLYPSGGTNIMEALAETVAYSTDIIDKHQTPVVVLFMTDGEDPKLTYTVAQEQTNPFFDNLGQNKSGFSIHFVGISQQAANYDLAYLAQRSNGGTFVCVQDDNIVDVMGMLIGLTQERCPHALSVDSKMILTKASGTVEKNLMEGEAIQLRKSMPSKLSFEMPPEVLGEWDAVQIYFKLTVSSIGAAEQTQDFVASAQITEGSVPLFVGAPILSHAEKVWANVNAKIAKLIHERKFDALLAEIASIKPLISTFKEALLQSPQDYEKIERFEATMLQEEENIVGSNHARIMDMETRALSAASTQRNASMTLDTQALESMSSAQHEAVDRIRTLSHSLPIN